MAATSESASVFPAQRRPSASPSVRSVGAAGSSRAERRAHDDAAAAECAAETLTHPLEILMDSPRVVRALGIAVPLLAQAAWRIAGAAGLAAGDAR